MIGLLATYLRPYARTIALVLGLLLVGAIGNLYLPDLQGDIINNGVVKGDTNYILRVGGLMLLVTAVVGVASIIAVYFSSKVAMGFGRDVRGAIFTTVQSYSQVEVNKFGAASLITRNTNERPAGPAGHLHRPDDHGLGTDPDRRRHSSWRSGPTAPCRCCCS
jgi:ATP-binding cassette subfamily B protein